MPGWHAAHGWARSCGERHLAPPCQRVVGRQHQPDALADQVAARQVVVHRPRLVVVLVPHHDVEVLEPERRHGLLDLAARWPRPAPADGSAASSRTAGATMRRNADWKAETRTTPATCPAATWATSASAASAASSSTPRVPDQDPAGLGQLDVAADPFEQGGARLPLEHRQLLGDRARRVAERLGGRADRAAGLPARGAGGAGEGRAFVQHI